MEFNFVVKNTLLNLLNLFLNKIWIAEIRNKYKMKGLTPSEKQLTIKTKVVERIRKEYLSYEKELNKEKEKLSLLVASNEGPSKIKNQENIVNETQAVFYNVKANLINEKENLQKIMDDNTDDKLSATEVWEKAKNTLGDVNKFIDDYVLKSE